MFTNILFLVLALLVIDVSPSDLNHPWPKESSHALFAILGVFFSVLFLTYIQNRFLKKMRHKNLTLILAHCELISFLLFAYNIAGIQRIYSQIPYISDCLTFLILVSLAFYFFGLGFYYYTSSHTPAFPKKITNVMSHIRFILPFTLPIIAYQGFLDILGHIPLFHLFLLKASNGDAHSLESILFFVVSFAFLTLVLLILPYFIQALWKCKPLTQSLLNERLEKLCQQAKFKHGGLKLWTVMRSNLTAAIIGIIPRFRYVMFTEALIKQFPNDEIEAVLSHEIGHSYHKHLLIYPLIFLGIPISIGVFTTFFWHYAQNIHAFLGETIFYLIVFFCFAIIIAIYFRFIFGFFSRLFERQADLHVFRLNISPYALINALNRIGVASGNTHDQPSWHHGSIRERINFLEHAMKNPSLIRRHHKKVKKILIAYFILLIIIALLMI